jgi:NADH:ubiquinone oxidoreductase subunit E/NAD-dependent dihydropyrimidine dehydrogenase PreA subunit
MSENVSAGGKKRGSVLIVGGGIGGMQAALDLAEGGFKVHMVQRDPSIGGLMSMLDKTFPTGDCAMCMISPKMVEVGRHPNINIMTMSDVQEITGVPGDFKVKVHHQARSVNPLKCTGCGECTRACPVRNIIRIPERPAPPALKPEWSALLNETVETYHGAATNLISMLQDINTRLRYLPREMLSNLAFKLDMPESHVLAVATFYNAFSLEPVGRHVIEVCSGTACHVKGSKRMIDRLKEELQIEAGCTTKDDRFTLRTVNCIGCCALAPAMRVDGEVYGNMRVRELPKILKEYT